MSFDLENHDVKLSDLFNVFPYFTCQIGNLKFVTLQIEVKINDEKPNFCYRLKMFKSMHDFFSQNLANWQLHNSHLKSMTLKT